VLAGEAVPAGRPAYEAELAIMEADMLNGVDREG
jgi:hypothetical protein